MKKSSIIFLQFAVGIAAIAMLAILIRLPLTEGGAANLDLLSIYADPFIIYVYLSSITFFVALYQTFKLLGYVGHNNAFSLASLKALSAIKYCAIILGILIVLAAAYIRIFHAAEDDPAGFIALGIAATFICIVVSTTASVLKSVLQSKI
jgi:hypothetical protein